MRKFSAFALAAMVGALLVATTATPVSAHEVVTLGRYVLTVGWQHEPTYVGVENGVQTFVHDLHGNAVADLADGALKVTVSTGSQTSGSLDLVATWDPDTGLGTKGEYDTALLPTAPGTYTFHITGSVHGQAIDHSFTSSTSTFDDVKDPTPIEFPTQQPTATELGQLTSQLQSRVAALQTSMATTQSNLNSAQSIANRDQTVAIVAVVIGLAGLVLAAVAWRRKAA
jgi:hypothetical protein